MSESWDDLAAGWDENEAVIAYSEKAFGTLCEVIEIRGAQVLDFGCGTGLLTEQLAPRVTSVTAIDPATKMIQVLEDKGFGNVTTVVGEVDEDFVRDCRQSGKRFDVVVASSALAFVPDYAETIELLTMLLADKGVLVQWDWEKVGDSSVGFSSTEIEEAYESAGLNVVSITHPFCMGDMRVIMAVGQREA